MSVQVLSIDQAPANQRAQLFRQQMQERFSVGLEVRPSSDKPFSTEIMAYCGRRLRFASLRFSPHRTSPTYARQSESSRLLVSMQMEGSAQFSQDDRQTQLNSGDFCLIDPSRPFVIETTEMVTHSLYLERNTLREVLPEIDALTARAIDGRNGVGALFTAMVNEMFKLAPTLDDDAADSIADALPYVLTTALSLLKHELLLLPPRLKMLHKQRIRRFVRENLCDHKLDAKLIATGVNISTRHIYELFSDEPEPLMKWVWSERLERCHRDLAAAALRSRSIGEIAGGWGFSDLAHFSRAFRDRYDMSPREWRKLALQQSLHAVGVA